MRRQRKMFQTKEQEEEELSEVKIGNLHEKKFRVVTVKVIDL